MHFGKGDWKQFSVGVEREWVITNGIGGYCSSTIIGANARKHHAYLIASLHAPVERYAVLNKIDEEVMIGKKEYSFATNQRPGGWNDEGQKYLQRFIYDELPHFIYQAEDLMLKKTLSFEYEKNTIAIGYEINNGHQASVIRLKPLFTYRIHHNPVERNELEFTESFEEQNILKLIPKKNENIKIRFYASEGEFVLNEEKYDCDMEYQIELDTGNSAIDNSYTPYDIVISLKPYEHKKVSIICTIEDTFEKDAFTTIHNGISRIQELKKKAGFEDAFANSLVQAADQFIVKRESTKSKTIMAGYPWFTDWGRDTMIALQGLTMVTKRFDDSRKILKSFAQYVKKGLVPNMFPDEGLEPLYNTADASLWYFYSVYKYLEYTNTPEDFTFIKNEIYPKLEEIIFYYSTKTDFSIYMDKDGLIHAGSGYDQVTWMDVRVGTWVVTPRHGKPVEINALWYNALRIMQNLSKRFGIVNKDYGKTTEEYANMADVVKKSFIKEFWNEELNCLYDVVDGQAKDESIRCNQIYAVSLPFSLLDHDKEVKIVEVVLSKLYATYGLRTLDKDNKEYKPFYKGKLHDRDAAYHQGTAWAYPLGAFITAYIKVYGKNENTISYAKSLLAPMQDHLRDGCIGSIAEIFDGDEPNRSRGAYSQAWSVGEILRAYTENCISENN